MDSEALLHRERCEYEGGSENIWGEGRRIQQVIKKYKEGGEVPVLKRERRPKTELSKEQKEIIEEVWRDTRVGARKRV